MQFSNFSHSSPIKSSVVPLVLINLIFHVVTLRAEAPRPGYMNAIPSVQNMFKDGETRGLELVINREVLLANLS